MYDYYDFCDYNNYFVNMVIEESDQEQEPKCWLLAWMSFVWLWLKDYISETSFAYYLQTTRGARLFQTMVRERERKKEGRSD